jgi:hypothetical protein
MKIKVCLNGFIVGLFLVLGICLTWRVCGIVKGALPLSLRVAIV